MAQADYLVLYALCRMDMASLKMGKLAAQAMHAQAMFDKYEIIQPLLAGRQPHPDVDTWHNEAEGFGTTLTIAIPDLETVEAVTEAAANLGFVSGMVVDPTYPFHVDNELVGRLDASKFTMPPVYGGPGRSVCFVSEATVGYVFGWKSKLSVLLARFGLVPNE
jgi:hypothetical protein